MIEIAEIIVQSLLKTSRQHFKIAASFSSHFVAKINHYLTIGKKSE